MNLDTIALALRAKFPDLAVHVDDGDEETHLPFLALQRPDLTIIAVVAETKDFGYRCCNVAQQSSYEARSVADVLEHCADALRDRKRLDNWK